VRRDSLDAALEEWDDSGRIDDYLLAGARLDEFTPLLTQGSLELTGRERDFLDACVEKRRVDDVREAARAADRRRLEVSARRRLLAFTGAALLALTFAFGVVLLPHALPARVGLVAPRIGAPSDLIESGFRRAVGDFGFVSSEWPVDGMVTVPALQTASAEGASPIVVFSMEFGDAQAVANSNPNTRYILLEGSGDAPNATYVNFADNEGGFLAGAVAALKTKTGMIGFIGGMNIPTILNFQAGFIAGARYINPNVQVSSAFLTQWPNYHGFDDSAAAQRTATQMYGAGADIIFHAAGLAGAGLFQAATDQSTVMGRQLWAIGVDSDQYYTVGQRAGSENQSAWQPHILTSVLKRFDTVLYDELRQFSRGELTGGRHVYGMSQLAFDISYSGGSIEDIRLRVEKLKGDIADGTIQVPCDPDSICIP